MAIQDAVIVAALALLRSMGMGDAVPAVEVVEPAQFPALADQVKRLRGFRLLVDGEPEPVIYVVRTTQTYELATRGDLPSTALVASTILHETVHGQSGGNERVALAAEAEFLQKFIRRNLLRLTTRERRYVEKHIDLLRRARKQLPPPADERQTPTLFAHGAR